MPHVVTQSCCTDGSCVYACPVNCIQPTPDDPAFATVEMLYVDPTTCVDCGACVSACPVGAIKSHLKLRDDERIFAEMNAAFHRDERREEARPLLARPAPPLVVRRTARAPRVAVVGSGPAAMYAADEVLTIPGASVDVYERKTMPYGLARTGVAPDHRLTRRVAEQFDVIRAQAGFRMHLGVEVGRDVTHEALLEDHDAVVYAVGAATDRRLEIPGIELPGVASATDFVAWYNGDPAAAGRSYDLSHRRAVIVGNGNVALDVARILTVDPESLAHTDIAPEALAALRTSGIEEVVVVGRRGPAQAAFTLPELIGLSAEPGVELVVEPAGVLDAEVGSTGKLDLLRGLGPGTGEGRRVALRFLRSPRAIVGTDRAQGVELELGELVPDAEGVVRSQPTGEVETVDAGLVLTSIGYRGVPVAGLPFDAAAGVVPNDGGRVVDPATGEPVPGTYVAGWIKRGPTGFIGTNKMCSQETVRALVEDHNAGRLAARA